ncbi:hypothetical protein M758_3G257300 [Ceratodon purpureus]|nr:hypothetical protein M758_3G257300 [Ceratodon purpureus]
MAQFMSKISGLFNSKPIGEAESTEQHLGLTKICMERAKKLTLRNHSTSPKFNFEQCKYLVDKLNMAVDSADSFLLLIKRGFFWFPSQEDAANCLEVFKLLHALATEVENFVQICSKDAWIQAAVTLSNVSEHISFIGFNLMLWTVHFSELTQLRGRRSLTLTQVDGIFKAEVEVVKVKASLDRETMLTNLHDVLQTRKPSSTDYQLAVLLLGRLDKSKKVPGGNSSGSSQASLSETIARSLQRMESLGKGSAGTVYRAKWLGAEVAQKLFYAVNFPDFEKEVSILAGLSHPKIATLLYCDKDKRECSIVMELMDEDLFSLIQRRVKSNRTLEFPFGILEAVDIIHQVGEGMRYLHEMKIVHRDLKSMNILVKYVRGADLEIEYVLAKVADFGLSKTKEKSMTYSNQTPNMGTPRWMAPETIKFCNSSSQAEMADGQATILKYPFKCDVYSFGIVCYEILTGELPFSTTSSPRDVKKMVLDGGRPPLPYECPVTLKRLIERCWSPDASKRPRFDDICSELRYLKYLLLMPSALKNVPRPALENPVYRHVPLSGHDTAAVIPAELSIPIGFKREAQPQWLVGLDIGTTYSGFAFAKGSQGQVCVNYDYPYAEKPYWKALTALYYKLKMPGLISHCASWGHLARSEYLANNVPDSEHGFYVADFKLLLPKELNKSAVPVSLPHPLTVETIMTDYLRHIGELALTQIKHQEDEGSFSRDTVQWCVAVPSMWDENAKEQMRMCMVNAGLVSPGEVKESVKVVLKAEAASYYCHPQLFVSLNVTDKIMVVDIGGSTVDIVVQEVLGSGNDFSVQELTDQRCSSGLCGGTLVDEFFMKFLFMTIGCLESYLRKDNPSYKLHLLNRWEEIKCLFGHDANSTELYEISLPDELARKWEAFENIGFSRRGSYSCIKLSRKNLEYIFDPVVDEILRLIAAQLLQVEGKFKAMFVVGGFAGSPYLMQRIRSRFSREIQRVQHIYCPYDPGSAIMQGAIMLAFP